MFWPVVFTLGFIAACLTLASFVALLLDSPHTGKITATGTAIWIVLILLANHIPAP